MLLIAARVSLLLALAFGVTFALRRSSAASRHGVWLAAFIAALVLPVATAVLPALRLAVLPEWPSERRSVAVVEQPVTVQTREPVTAAALAMTKDRTHATHFTTAHFSAPVIVEAAPAARWPWSTRLILIWLTGAVMVAAAFAIDVLRTHLLACSAVPQGDLLNEEVEVLSASLGIVKDVKVVTWDGPAMPMTWGALRPVVLVPEAARGWSAERRREVLLHELAHVRRGDWAARLIAALVCALHWFNPLAWLAARSMRTEQELACDDAVLAGGASASNYASNLLDVARSLRSPARGLRTATVAMARPSQLTGRLLRILDEHRAPGPLFAGLGGRIGAGLTLVLAIPLAAAVPAHRDPAPWKAELGGAIAGAIGKGIEAGIHDGIHDGIKGDIAAAITAPTAGERSRMALLTRASDLDGCDPARRPGSNNSNSSNSNDDGRTKVVSITITRGDCVVVLRIVGNVTLADDESDVTSVPAGGSLRITEQNGDDDKRFDATFQNGQIQRRFRVNGSDVPESPELRRWLAAALQFAMVESGYDAVPRMLRAYRAGGLDSALKLSSATESDYAKREMLQALIDSVHVPARDAERIAEQASTISSDYEKAELLVAIATKLQLNQGVQEAMINASTHIGSDYERARVLTTALSRTDLAPDAASNLIRSAAGIGSDYEKAELLIKYLKLRPIPENVRATFFEASNSIGSDYEHRRLLSELLNRSDTQASVVNDVCTQAAHIGSDYERAELLVQVATKFGANSDARAQVRHAAEGIGSDYERNRVMAVLGRVE